MAGTTTQETLYDVGDLIRIRFESRVNEEEISPQNELTDPTDLILKIKEPDGTISTFTFSESPTTIIRSSLGKFYYDFDITQEGRHYYKWNATGVAQSSEEASFKVKDSQFV